MHYTQAIQSPLYEGPCIDSYLKNQYDLQVRSGFATETAQRKVEVLMWELLLQVAKGLAHIHHCGVTHFDCNRSNILVGDERGTAPPVAKIIDFGHAQRGFEVARCIPERSRFMSPEEAAACRAKKEQRVDGPKCDVYRFGNLVYSLVLQARHKWALYPSNYFPLASGDVACNGKEHDTYSIYPDTIEGVLERIEQKDACGPLEPTILALFRGVYQNDPNERFTMEEAQTAIQRIIDRLHETAPKDPPPGCLVGYSPKAITLLEDLQRRAEALVRSLKTKAAAAAVLTQLSEFNGICQQMSTAVQAAAHIEYVFRSPPYAHIHNPSVCLIFLGAYNPLKPGHAVRLGML